METLREFDYDLNCLQTLRSACYVFGLKGGYNLVDSLICHKLMIHKSPKDWNDEDMEIVRMSWSAFIDKSGWSDIVRNLAISCIRYISADMKKSSSLMTIETAKESILQLCELI